MLVALGFNPEQSIFEHYSNFPSFNCGKLSVFIQRKLSLKKNIIQPIRRK